MLDIGWSELMVIGVLALIVVGPKELPRLLRTIGQFVGKARSMAREFQRSMEEAAREADLKELTDLKRDMDRMSRVRFDEQAKRSSDSLAGKRKAAAATAEAPEAPAGAGAPDAVAATPEAAKPAGTEAVAKPAGTEPAAKPAGGGDAAPGSATPPDPAAKAASAE